MVRWFAGLARSRRPRAGRPEAAGDRTSPRAPHCRVALVRGAAAPDEAVVATGVKLKIRIKFLRDSAGSKCNVS